MLFQSSHNLEFEVAEFKGFDPNVKRFRVGTCSGIWKANDSHKRYEIIGIANEEIGNGHFKDVIEWFEQSCKRDCYDLAFMELWNPRLKKHLKKIGFIKKGADMIKHF